MAALPSSVLGRLILKVYNSHTQLDTHPVGRHCMSDQLVTEPLPTQHATHTTQCTYNVTLMRVRITAAAVEKQQYVSRILSVYL